MVEENKGQISEWNEANFKSMRLHEIQEIINVCTLYPFKRTNDEWNFKLWFNSIVVLFKEGMSKYAPSEYKSCSVLKKQTEALMNSFPLRSSEGRVTVNPNQWEVLKTQLELFEYKVKLYNDKHGLSTRNRQSEGLF